jgi:hypothetical protein
MAQLDILYIIKKFCDTTADSSPLRRRHFAAAASHILSSRSQPFSRRAAAASHICVTAATPYFLANYNFHERKRFNMPFGPFLQCDYCCMTYKLLNPMAHALIGLVPRHSRW